jgi:CheY-like chemotaxis protein
MTNVRPRILLLEDKDNWIHLVSLLLKNDYDVIPAKTLEDARRLVASSVFHLAIVDISLIPEDRFDEQGFQLMADLRATEILRDMSIIVLSGYPDVEGAETPERVRVAFRDYKVVDFFDKSRFDKAEFKRTVVEAIADSYLGSMRESA